MSRHHNVAGGLECTSHYFDVHRQPSSPKSPYGNPSSLQTPTFPRSPPYGPEINCDVRALSSDSRKSRSHVTLRGRLQIIMKKKGLNRAIGYTVESPCSAGSKDPKAEYKFTTTEFYPCSLALKSAGERPAPCRPPRPPSLNLHDVLDLPRPPPPRPPRPPTIHIDGIFYLTPPSPLTLREGHLRSNHLTKLPLTQPRGNNTLPSHPSFCHYQHSDY